MHATLISVRREKQCYGTHYMKQESFCGRPLGLQFYHATGELYIVDPYFGLMKVGPQGGLAEQLAAAADGHPFFLLNNLDVDQETGAVYFTDSSNQFRRRDWVWSILIREATGRLLKYEPSTRRVTVLLDRLAFPNGVALSQDSSSVLVAESTTSRILRYWLRGPKNGTSDVFATVPDYPDNLKRNSDGEFWVAVNNGKGKVEGIGKMNAGDGGGGGGEDTVGVRIDGEGRVVEVLREVGAAGAVSEVDEVNGTLWFGSLIRPFVGFYILSILTTLTVRPSVARTLPPNPRKELLNYVQLNLTSAFGPESLAFDPAGRGPYTGLSDGRVIKWDHHRHRWVDFAITTPHSFLIISRRSKNCQGTDYLEQESLCGRPLGLQFCAATGDLYIADAYYGLLVVGPEGGLATQLATAADGQPFFLTNAVDVDQETGEVYFTDSSSQFHRKDWMWSIITHEATGRLLKYDPRTKQVTVLLRALAFGNGVALSKDNSYILITETTRSRILRYWLQGPKSGTSDVFLDVPQYPDNIKRTPKGELGVLGGDQLRGGYDREVEHDQGGGGETGAGDRGDGGDEDRWGGEGGGGVGGGGRGGLHK
ncbi:Strictosidine synthase 1 [Acorus calamus]|uniref:Strictosidine synthase 1 n=1 Tax=Acorus calamus TaxID=4465 RepID=A0AAV9EPT8_ACOCL|nr:Strictosidine synthase 1 [Acorus calamus]